MQDKTNIPKWTDIKPAAWSLRRTIAGLIGTAVLTSMGMPMTSFAADTPQANSPGGTHAKGRILVMPRAGLPDAEFAKILRPHGGKARAIGGTGVYIVDLPSNASEQAVAALLAHNPHVKFAELDRRIAPGLAINDPYAGSEWHLAKIGAMTAWDSTQGSGVIIAILDSGVDGTHPDLAANLVAGWNFYDNNSNTTDVYGHGTAVAGTAAAVTNNGTGVASVAGGAKIMPIRISDTTGYAYWSTVAQGVTWAADHGAKVANLSYVGAAASSSVQSAAQYMKNKGGLVVVAAGNNGVNENITPTTTLIPVSATDSNDQITSWSSYGSFVAVSAPGLGIWTTTNGGGYGQWWGTSFASPVTSGVVALIMAAKPILSAAQVENILYSTAVDLGAAGRDVYYGYGRVNAAGAVAAALGAAAVPDTTPPIGSITDPLGSATVSGVATVNVSASDNVGVTRVELRANGVNIATDTVAPYGFSWDTTKQANGSATLVAYTFDAAGNSSASPAVTVNVANNSPTMLADIMPPAVTFQSPTPGSVLNGSVVITTNASDNNGAAGITQWLYIDGVQKASSTGGTLSFKLNLRPMAAGIHVLQVVARDAAGNTSSASEAVTVQK